MVQTDFGNKQKSISDKLRRLLRRTKIIEVPLEFEVGVDDEGKQKIRVFMIVDGKRSKVKDLKKFWKYGLLFEKDNVRYVLSLESLTTLLAIKSLNPEVSNGTVISEIYPSVLAYLRKQRNIHEAESSKRFRIQEVPLKHGATVSFDPAQGLHVKAGYQVPDYGGVLGLADLPKSVDEDYVRFHDTFYRLPDEEKNVKEWIELKEKTIGLEEIPEFFKHDLILLKSNFNAMLTESAKKIKIIDQRFQPRFKLEVDGGGWLDFKVDYKVGDYELSNDVLQGFKSDYIRPDDNTWIRVDRDSVDKTEKQLKALDPAKSKDGYRVEIARFQSVEEAIEQLGGIRQVSREYQHFLDEISDFKPSLDFKLPSEYEKYLFSQGITLRPYQRVGISWLDWLMKHHLHGILADDMGLGKTIQTLATMRLMYESTLNTQHSLIICPKSVVGHWWREIRRVLPHVKVLRYTGPLREKFTFTFKGPIIFITTYEILSRDIEILGEIPFFFIVLDEGTRIKNPDTKRTLAAKTLNAAHRVVLSGTPIENRPLELWSIFDFLIKGHLGSYDEFLSRFERPIQEGDEGTSKMLANRIKPFILRRLKEDVAKDLPEKIEMSYWCDLTEEQRSLYGQLQDKYIRPVRRAIQRGESVSYVSILPIITKLKQVCDHPALITGDIDPLIGRSEKFDFVVETIDEILERDEAAVIFTHFLGLLDLLESYLRKRKIAYIRIDGSTMNRQELIDRFNAGQASIAICSLLAASHGINLTAANHIIHVDRWWNPAVEDQATDRVHRIGQTKTVYVYKILTEGTLEEKIDALLRKKRGISDRVMQAAANGAEGWTKEELLEILKPLSSAAL